MARGRLPGFKTEGARDRYVAAYNRTLEAAGMDVCQHDVPTRFGTTHVLEVGETTSPPLVLLHTMSFSSTVWARNLLAFSASRRVLAIDTIGDINLSQSTNKVTDRDDYVDWFTDVVAPFELTTAAIVGNSYGGWLGAKFVVAPSRPRVEPRLDLAAIGLREVQGCLLGAPRQRRIRTFGEIGEAIRAMVRHQPDVRRPSSRSWLEQVSIGMPFFAGMNDFPRPTSFSDDELRSIATPILLIEGEQEPMHDPHASIVARSRDARRCQNRPDPGNKARRRTRATRSRERPRACVSRQRLTPAQDRPAHTLARSADRQIWRGGCSNRPQPGVTSTTLSGLTDLCIRPVEVGGGGGGKEAFPAAAVGLNVARDPWHGTS